MFTVLCRIHEVPGRSKEQVAEIVSVMLKKARGVKKTVKEIIEDNTRYYVMVRFEGVRVSGFEGYAMINVVDHNCAVIYDIYHVGNDEKILEETLKELTKLALSKKPCVELHTHGNEKLVRIAERLGYRRVGIGTYKKLAESPTTIIITEVAKRLGVTLDEAMNLLRKNGYVITT